MKVKVEVTLDVNPEAWVDDFGVARSEVREDVKGYFAGLCIEHAQTLGHIQSDVEWAYGVNR